MNLYFLGGAMEIGGSCIYVKAAEKRILLDCGIRQSGSKDPLPDFRTIQEQGGLDAIIISHAHMDHIGTLPIISKAYPDARIYMTAMTADLTRVLLYDSLKIMKYKEDEIPHYTEQDVLAMLERITPIRYQTEFPVFDNFTLTFYPAGHIAGAACIYLVTEDGTLFYSGDFAAFAQRTIEGIHIPKLRPDIAIVETTYGNRLHANRQVEERRLVELVRECIEQRRKILIPAFALGRAQEVLLILRAAIQNGEIPPVLVYVDGMVRDINTMYTRNPTFLKNALGKRILKGNEPFYTKEIQPVAPNQKRDELLSGKDPVILVSSSGMLTGGPSTQYAKQLAPSENACIIITGYQDEESPGRKLLNLLESPGRDASPEPDTASSAPGENGLTEQNPMNPVPAPDGSKLTERKLTECRLTERKLTLDGASFPVRCQVEQVGLSAHGDKSEITALLDRLSARHIFLVHGNEEVIHELGNELAAEDFRRHVYLPECGQEYSVSLRAKRKQLNFVPVFTMQKTDRLTPENIKSLWDYWQEHYSGKRFPVSRIAFIWHGRPVRDEAALQAMQDTLLDSPYFSTNMRQLFLIEANTPEDVAEALRPKELTIQDLEPHIQELFTEYNCRKVSYHRDRREVLLLFDYPDSVPEDSFQKKAEIFQKQTGWTIGINPSMNHNAAGSLLYTLFQEQIQKISYYADRKCYAVALTGITEEDRLKAERFQEETGWQLLVNGKNLCANNNPAVFDGSLHVRKDTDAQQKTEFTPRSQKKTPLEQNLAFFCIAQQFSDLPHTIEKKSLKRDEKGAYLECSFISPAIGQRYRKDLQEIADQTGWRIRIADKVNQNGLFQNIQMLCAKHKVPILKNPSYLPQRRAVAVKVAESADENAMEQVAAQFEERTGCCCEFVK